MKALPVQCAGNCVELKQASCDNFCTPSEATSGLRFANMGNASAHDAQNATGAHRSAERKPNPPTHWQCGKLPGVVFSFGWDFTQQRFGRLPHPFIMGLALGQGLTCKSSSCGSLGDWHSTKETATNTTKWGSIATNRALSQCALPSLRSSTKPHPAACAMDPPCLVGRT